MIVQAAKMNAHYKHGPTNIPPLKSAMKQMAIETTHSVEKSTKSQEVFS